MPAKRSCVHPPFKTKYRVENWSAYDRALVERGSLTFWISPEAIEDWSAKPSGRRGAQPKFSDLAIETALTLRLIFHLPLRQTEGFLRSLFDLLDLDLEAPDHTTLSRRSRSLDIELCHCTPSQPMILILDSVESRRCRRKSTEARETLGAKSHKTQRSGLFGRSSTTFNPRRRVRSG